MPRLPEHWSNPPLYLRFEIALGKMLDTSRIVGSSLLPYLRNVDVQWSSINTIDLPVMDVAESERERFTVKPGDLLVCEGGEIGRAAIWEGAIALCAYQKALHRVRPLSPLDDTRFLRYVLWSAAHQGVFLAEGNPNTIPHLTGEAFRLYRFPRPPIDEQRAIAGFLDAETEKIDALVAEQQRLIELLKEKRQAVISHAVTKGLNPDAPMKDSGVEWLGAVPTHWDVHPLRRVAVKVMTGGTPDSVDDANVEDGAAWFTPGDFDDSLVLIESLRKIPWSEIGIGSVKLFPARSVLVVSIGATLGKVGFAPSASTSNQQINAIIPSNRVDGNFLTYSLAEKSDVMRFLSNSSTIGIMNQEKTKEILVAIPPIEEQRAIVEWLRGQLAANSELVTQAESAIRLLQERRTALITAAVTGQIDVRNNVPSEAE